MCSIEQRLAYISEEIEEKVIADAVKKYNALGQLHSYNDEPSVINNIGKYWLKDGKLHRDNDLPAVIQFDGVQCWYKHGKKHRDGGKPAQIGNDYIQFWEDGVYKGTYIKLEYNDQ